MKMNGAPVTARKWPDFHLVDVLAVQPPGTTRHRRMASYTYRTLGSDVAVDVTVIEDGLILASVYVQMLDAH